VKSVPNAINFLSKIRTVERESKNKQRYDEKLVRKKRIEVQPMTMNISRRNKANKTKATVTDKSKMILNLPNNIAEEREIEVFESTGNQSAHRLSRVSQRETSLCWAADDTELTNVRVQYTTYGINPMSVLFTENCKVPSPRENDLDVVISIEASIVSKVDCLRRCGRYSNSSRNSVFPQTPGVDCVGHIVKCSSFAAETHGVKIFDRVAAFFSPELIFRYLTSWMLQRQCAL